MGRHYQSIAVASKCTVFIALSAGLTCNAFITHPHSPQLSVSGTRKLPSVHCPSLSSIKVVGTIIHSTKGTNPSAHSDKFLTSLPHSSIIAPRIKDDLSLPAVPSDSAEGECSPTTPADDDGPSTTTTTEDSPPPLQFQTIALLVGAQSLLLPISAVLAKTLGIPNSGLGAGFEVNSSSVARGILWTAPLFAVAGIMQLLEPYSSAVQGVTKATQRSVLAVMGRKRRRPGTALSISILLGTVAGWGEEWLFRGVFQTLLAEKFSSQIIGLGVSGIVFGLLHAVTPIYALLAGLASLFFGKMYMVSQNLAVPMVCHAVYDIAALLWAHWSATALSTMEQDEILESGPGAVAAK